MYKFSKKSKKVLSTCDPVLQSVMEDVLLYKDISIISGHRGSEEQDKLFAEGKSKLKYPNSKHNSNPSKAVDVAPYPHDWSRPDPRELFLIAGLVKGIGLAYGVNITWGGDWDNDGDITDQKFQDLYHFEIS